MTALRVFTVLDAALPHPIALPGQIRLWVVAGRWPTAVRMLRGLGITWREATFAGPVAAGPFVTAMQRCGLFDRPAVYAYPVPFTAGTTLLRVDTAASTTRVAAMGDVFTGPAARR